MWRHPGQLLGLLRLWVTRKSYAIIHTLCVNARESTPCWSRRACPIGKDLRCCWVREAVRILAPFSEMIPLSLGILRYASHAQVVNRAPQYYKIFVRTPYGKSLPIEWHVCDISWTLYSQFLRFMHRDVQAFLWILLNISTLVKRNVNPFRPAEHAFTCVLPACVSWAYQRTDIEPELVRCQYWHLEGNHGANENRCAYLLEENNGDEC